MQKLFLNKDKNLYKLVAKIANKLLWLFIFFQRLFGAFFMAN